jgi:hypothetical protein
VSFVSRAPWPIIALFAWVPLLLGSGHFNHSGVTTNSGIFCGNNAATADFQAGDTLHNSDCTQAPQGGYSVTSAHTKGRLAGGDGTWDAEPLGFTCWIGPDASATGTAEVNLGVVQADGADTSIENLATLSWDIATEDASVKSTSSFTAATSSKPYFFVVTLADGGSISIATSVDVACEVVWENAP